jgi:hypothetical protein
MADIKPMLKELKSKIPSKEQVMAFIDGMDLQVDTKKIKETTTKLQTQAQELAEAAANNPKVQEVVSTLLSSKATNTAILKLKEVLPNQEIIDRIDKMRLAIVDGLAAAKAEATTTATTETKAEDVATETTDAKE